MSTRSITLIRSEFADYDWETKEYKSSIHSIARFYRHCDGYPEGHGLHIALALAKVSLEPEEVNNRNWAQHFLKNICAMNCDVEFEPPSKADGGYAHGDLEYIYRITGSQDYTGGKEGKPDAGDCVCMEVFAVDWSMNLDADYSQLDSMEPMFKGTWRGFLPWIREDCMGRGEYASDPFAYPYSPQDWVHGTLTEEEWKTVQGAAGYDPGA